MRHDSWQTAHGVFSSVTDRASARRAQAIAAAILVAVTASPTAAQRVSGDNRPFGNGGVTSFAPVQGRGYNLNASVTTLYDSNILRGSDGFASSTGQSRGDFRITPRVSGAVGVTVGRQQLFFGGEVGRDFYLRNTQYNRNRYGVGGGANFRAGRSCEASVSGEYLSQRALLSESLVSINDVQTTRNYNGIFSCSPPLGLGFGGSVRHSDTRYDTFSRSIFDARSTAYNGYLSYGLPALGVFQLGGGYTRVDYPKRSVFTDGTGLVSQIDGLDIFNGRLGYRRGIGARMSIELGVGYNRVKPDPRTIFSPVHIGPFNFLIPNDRSSYGGISFDGDVSYHPSSRLSGDLRFSRAATSSPTVGALYVIDTLIGVDVGYKIGPSLTAGIGGTFNDRDYRNSFTSPTEGQARLGDRIYRGYGRVTYSPRPLYSIDLEVAHEQRDSRPAFYSTGGTTAQLTLRVKLGRG